MHGHYQDYPKYTYMCLPCTRSSAGSLSLLGGGKGLTAVHVMLVLSKEVNAVSFNLDKYMPCAIGINVIFCPLLISTPLVLQTMLSLLAVQLNSATSLSETLTDCGECKSSTN